MTLVLSMKKSVSWLFATVAVGGMIAAGLTVAAAPAHADVVATGTGGQYVATTSRIMDTRNGTGGYSTAMPAGTWRKVQIAGVNGLPSTGIGSISVVATVITPNTQGLLSARPSGSTSSTLLLTYGGGNGTVANTGTVAVGSDGAIEVQAQNSQNITLDVQGYYTTSTSGTAPGGFVSIPGKRIADTSTGTGVTKATIAAGSSVTVQATGSTSGVPADAAAVMANFVVTTTGANAGSISAYPTGSTNYKAPMTYPAVSGLSTAISEQVALSSDGKITVSNASGASPINLTIDIQGYFTASDRGGVFTPAYGQLFDTRLTNSPVAADGTITVPVSGVKGVPSLSSGVSSIAITLSAVHGGTGKGTATVWADGTTEPTPYTSIAIAPNSNRTATLIVPIGSNGNIKIHNRATDSSDFAIDLQGWYNSLPTGPEVLGLTGSRPSATNLSFGITDQTSAQVDVATGNLQVSTVGLTLPGATSSTPIGASYNSRSQNVADSRSSDANRWEYALAAAGDLSANSKGVVYTAADGATWQFTPSNSTGSYTSPAGLLQQLTRTGSDFTLKDLSSNQTIHFNFAGQPTSIVDRNTTPNTTTFTRPNGYTLTGIVSTAGPIAARTAAASYSNGTQTFTQTNGSSSRSISWAKDSNGNITTYTDALGKTTSFGYSNGSDLTTITAPGGGVTTITYDSSDRVTQVSQGNTTSGSPGTATTRLQYTSSTQTLVAGPNTDTSVAVGTVAHTTYTLVDATHLVTNAVDAAGRTQSATYNPANNGVASSTAGAGSTASTTTGTYGQNNSQSLTKVQSGTGSASSATYGSSAPTAYLPASSTDASGNATQYGYDPAGNQTSTSTGSGATAATANVAYNTDGTVKTATAPANTGNPTTYTYDGNKQLSTVTPPTGTSLGVKTYTYDAFGRQASQTDGRGNTTSYTYDNDDRLLTTSFSDGTTTVTSTYDANGNQLTQRSATGTVTNTFDQQNRVVSTVNTAGGGTVSYTYDKMGNVVSTTADGGTVTNSYDPSGVLTGTQIPNSSGTTLQAYKVDDHGRRTDTWLGANALVTPTDDPNTYKAHTITTYDGSNKVTRVQSYVGTGNTSNTLVFDTSYCYYAGTTAPTCTATAANDRTQLQWARNNITGQNTTYTYAGTRLQSAAQSGGTSNTSWTYAYDNNGNRTGTQVSVNGGAPTVQGLTFNAASQITTAGYAYDGAGNLTASPGATYTYNGAEQMTSSTANGVTTRYTYAGADQNQVLSETTAGTDSYTYAYGGRGELLIQGTGGATYDIVNDASTGQAIDLVNPSVHSGMYLYDGIGNPVGILTDTGTRAYDISFAPYGIQTINAGGSSDWYGNTPYGFKAGARTDGDALVKFGLRWYLPTTGTWTQRDTLDAPLDPVNANRYAYAGDDPVNNSDASGRGAGAAIARLIRAVAAGKSIFTALNHGDILSLATGFAVTTLCEAAVAVPTGGIGAVVSVGFCALVGEVFSKAAENIVDEG
jgi:RHS repeat-associated protein